MQGPTRSRLAENWLKTATRPLLARHILTMDACEAEGKALRTRMHDVQRSITAKKTARGLRRQVIKAQLDEFNRVVADLSKQKTNSKGMYHDKQSNGYKVPLAADTEGNITRNDLDGNFNELAKYLDYDKDGHVVSDDEFKKVLVFYSELILTVKEVEYGREVVKTHITASREKDVFDRDIESLESSHDDMQDELERLEKQIRDMTRDMDRKSNNFLMGSSTPSVRYSAKSRPGLSLPKFGRSVSGTRRSPRLHAESEQSEQAGGAGGVDQGGPKRRRVDDSAGAAGAGAGEAIRGRMAGFIAGIGRMAGGGSSAGGGSGGGAE